MGCYICFVIDNQSAMDLLSFDTFCQLCQWGGYTPVEPTPLQYTTLLSQLKRRKDLVKFQNLKDFGMFLAHVLHETEGLRHLSDPNPLKAHNDPYKYPDHWRSKVLQILKRNPIATYHPRGYLGLETFPNYYYASHAILGTNELCINPNLVEEDERIAWNTGFWIWGQLVHPNNIFEFEDTLNILGTKDAWNEMERRRDLWNHVRLVLDC